MDLGLKDKVALVTGASKGMGKAIALGLAQEGCKISICARNKDPLDQTAKEIAKLNEGNVLAILTDLTKADEVEALVKKTLEHFGRIDILVSNSGGPPTTPFLEITDEAWQHALSLNLLNTIRLIRSIAPTMINQKWGRIIINASMSVKQPFPDLVMSNTVRTGVLGLAKSLSQQFAQYNILVNTLCPGYISTERATFLFESRAVKQGTTIEEVIKITEQGIPLGRQGTPEEVANLAVFLASERASYITGTTIQVDGGVVKSIL